MLPLHSTESTPSPSRRQAKFLISKRSLIICSIIIFILFLLFVITTREKKSTIPIQYTQNLEKYDKFLVDTVDENIPSKDDDPLATKEELITTKDDLITTKYDTIANKDETMSIPKISIQSSSESSDKSFISNHKKQTNPLKLIKDQKNEEIEDGDDFEDEVKENNAKTDKTIKIENEKINYEEATKSLQDKSSRFITFIITTVSRSTPYLEKTLNSILDQLPPPNIIHNPFVHTVRIYIVNNNPIEKKHDEYERIKNLCSQQETVFGKKCSNYVIFSALGTRKRIVGKSDGYQNKVLQQTSDVAKAFELMNEELQKIPSQYFIIMEDDWLLCKNAWISLQYLINKVETQFTPSDWIALRFSYGLNGILFQGSDLPALKDFFLSKLSSLSPPDHLIYEFMKSHHEKNRKIIVFRHNLYNHIGDISSLVQRKRANPGCFGYMYDWLQPLEIFDNANCPYDDISPCPLHNEKSMLVDWDMGPTETHRKHYPFCDKNVKTEDEALIKACRIKKK